MFVMKGSRIYLCLTKMFISPVNSVKIAAKSHSLVEVELMPGAQHTSECVDRLYPVGKFAEVSSNSFMVARQFLSCVFFFFYSIIMGWAEFQSFLINASVSFYWLFSRLYTPVMASAKDIQFCLYF